MRRRWLPRALLLAGVVALCGCTDPYLREGTWQSSGVNEANLRAMVADPKDLEWGVSRPETDGQVAAAAVMRLRAGQVNPLPGDAISKIGAAAAPPAPAPPTAPPPAAGGS